jgi:hypothetical protein
MRTQANFCAIFAAAVGLLAPLRAEPTAQVVSVFSEFWAQNRGGIKAFGLTRQGLQVSRVYLQGSAWAVELDRHTYLVTAAHVVGVGTHPSPTAFQAIKSGEIITRTKIDWASTQLTETAFVARVGIGDFGTRVKSVGSGPDLPNDLALLEPATDQVWTELRPTRLAANTPRVGDQVQVLGIPKTFAQQLTNATVTAVFEQQGYFVLNTALEAGYSGGLVTGKDGLAVGMVTSTSKEQTTVSLVTSSRLKGATFKPADQVLSLHPEVFPGLK